MNPPLDRADPPRVLRVSELNRRARTLLESHFDFVWVGGEISNFARPSSGHWYFTLKDGDAQVRCAMFRNRNQRLRFIPDQGDEVRVRCRVSLYEGRGEFQLIVEHLEPAGAGALQVAFEKLKAKLLAEGLFEATRKRELPAQITRLGVVTSPTGAAIHDMLTVLRRRCPGIEVCLLPVAVQGAGAGRQIAAAIERANRWQREGHIHLDVLVIGRGGGSLEDLQAFNEEVVARAIAASELPVVSAVGHEVDFSIADLVADRRAPTPSAAAEMLSPDRLAQHRQLEALQRALARQITTRLAASHASLQWLARRLKHPGARLREQAQRVDELEQRLLAAQSQLLRRHLAALQLLHSQLLTVSPAQPLQRLQAQVHYQQRLMHAAVQRRLREARSRLRHGAQLLDTLSPLRVLERGYAILTDADGRTLTDPGTVAVGDDVEARLAGGRLGLRVRSTTRE